MWIWMKMKESWKAIVEGVSFAAVIIGVAAFALSERSQKEVAERQVERLEQQAKVQGTKVDVSKNKILKLTDELAREQTGLTGESVPMAATQREAEMKQELAKTQEKVRDLDAQLSIMRADRDSLARELQLNKSVAGGLNNIAPNQNVRSSVSVPGSSVQRPTVALNTLIGRWVGVAECTRGTYPASIDINKATAAELSLKYSDSKNSQTQDGTLILLPSGTGQVTFAFRVDDDRFIVMKNGNRLVLESSGLLVSPPDRGNQCKLELSRS